MALPLQKPVILPRSEERRRFQRVKVNLLGRYMLSDRREYPCQVINMSPGGMALLAAVCGRLPNGSLPMSTTWWLANRHILGLPEDRRHDRIAPRNPFARLILPNGLNVACRVMDISQSGAAIKTDQRRSANHHRQDLGAGCASSRRGHRDRVHASATSRLC
jgi:hypothetical protein